MLLATVDPKRVIVSIAGGLVTGFANGKITVQRDTPISRTFRGVDGEVARLLTDNRIGTITIPLLRTSPSNISFSILANADELTGAVGFPVLIKDLDGTDLIVAAIAHIESFPRPRFGLGETVLEWTFKTGDVRLVSLGREQT